MNAYQKKRGDFSPRKRSFFSMMLSINAIFSVRFNLKNATQSMSIQSHLYLMICAGGFLLSDSIVLRAFGSAVRRHRTAIGISQEALADLCDLHRTYIGGVERGERNLGLLNIYAIAHALGITAEDLFHTTTTLLKNESGKKIR